MLKQGCLQILVIFSLWCLSGCSSIWTGAQLVYDRHDVYKKLDDYHLYVKVNNAITVDKLFKDSRSPLDIAVFNGDVLIAGQVPTQRMHAELQRRLDTVQGARRMFNEVRVDTNPPNSMEDNWITAKIRSQIFADASIDPNAFKVVTSKGIVYLMGDVRPDEAATVINFTRHTAGVRHVVKVLKYLVYQK